MTTKTPETETREYYLIEGFYYDFGEKKRVWKRWNSEGYKTAEAAKTQRGYLGNPNPQTTSRSSPSRWRIVKVLETVEVIEED